MTMIKTPRGMHRNRTDDLVSRLSAYEHDHGSLIGLADPSWRTAFVDQIVSSLRRVEFINVLHSRDISAERMDPFSLNFDPLKGAVLLLRDGKIEEAIWLAFVATHFGKHAADGWKLARNVFGGFGTGPVWTVGRYRSARLEFEAMLVDNQTLLYDPSASGRYSNHRQYQSKNAAIIARVFVSFHDWQFACGGFVERMRQVHQSVGQDPTIAFDALYRSMRSVYGFGRLGKFDFLTMAGKLQLAPIVPGSVYLSGSTGPLLGAKLLYHGDRNAKVGTRALGKNVDGLDEYLDVGKQVLEDSLCNWQKNPGSFLYFRG